MKLILGHPEYFRVLKEFFKIIFEVVRHYVILNVYTLPIFKL